jgi:hypothetical protein
MGLHQRNVGNYAMANGTLSNSVNQLTREMPAFGNSIGTGFMAISNNLPIFFDEISKLKQANLDLQATGQPTQSVLKQVASSVFSIGTALSVGVTLLTLFGAKMVDFISKQFSHKKETESYLEVKKRQNEAIQKGIRFVAEESAEYVGVISTLRQTNAGSKERSELIKKINDQYGTTLQNLSDEKAFQDQLNNSVKNYLEYKRQEFTIQQNEQKITNNLIKQSNLDKEIYLTKKRISELDAQKLVFEKQYQDVSFGSFPLGQELERAKVDLEVLKEEKRQAEERLKTYGLNIADANQKRGGLGFGNNVNATKQKLQEIKDYTRDIEDERMRQMLDSLGKEQMLIYIRETRRIEDLKNELGDEKQKAVLIKEIETNMIADILKLEDDFYREQEKKRNEHMKVLSDQLDELDEQEYQRELKNLEDINKVRETNLLNSDANDKQIAKMTRQNQIDMLEQKIILAKQHDKDVTDLELELAKLRQQKIANVTKTEFINLMKPIIEAEIKMSQKRVELLDKEMAKRQEAYNLYTELAKNGTIQAQQSLALEQQAIVEANKKKAEEMKRQERLKFAESTFSAYASNVDKGEKNPLLKTITDMTLLRQFISSMPSFLVGTEDTGANGNGVDGKGGFHAILHPNERVMTKEQNAMLGGLKNDEVAETIANVRSGKIVSLKHDKAGNSFDLKPLLSEIQELKQVIRQKPETNIELGQIVQGAMEIVQTTKQGNTVKRNRYIV